MTKIVSIKDMPLEYRIMLLQELGFKSDGRFVLDKTGEKVLDKYTNDPVLIENMAILPGSTIILDDNPISITAYLEEYGDDC